MSGRSAKAARRAAVAAGKPPRAEKRARQEPARPSRLKLAVWVLLALPVVVGGLYALTALGKGGGGGSSAFRGSGAYPYAVGSPGPGEPAPQLTLPSTSGGTFDLASYRGKQQVLLFFQEGLTCEPCWTQLKAIQKELPKFRALGIGPIVSVTTDPLGDIEQKVKDEGITIPVSQMRARRSRARAAGRRTATRCR